VTFGSSSGNDEPPRKRGVRRKDQRLTEENELTRAAGGGKESTGEIYGERVSHCFASLRIGSKKKKGSADEGDIRKLHF